VTASKHDVEYVLGHSTAELRRLVEQSELYRPLTDAWLAQAGLRPGSTVLDLGCGAGDVAMAIADLVGPTGAVIGVDRSEEALELAGRRVAALGYPNITFELAELDEYEPPGPLDALVGRLVLMYQPDPAATLARLRPWLTRGAVVACQEMDMNAARSVPMAPLVAASKEWVLETFRRSGAPVDQGSTLHRVYRRAGLPAPQLSVGQLVGADGARWPCRLVSQVLGSLLPRTVGYGIATEAEIALDTLEDRLEQQLLALDAVFYSPMLVGATARLD
jgi:SAM-dependent methyltransferase